MTFVDIARHIVMGVTLIIAVVVQADAQQVTLASKHWTLSANGGLGVIERLYDGPGVVAQQTAGQESTLRLDGAVLTTVGLRLERAFAPLYGFATARGDFGGESDIRRCTRLANSTAETCREGSYDVNTSRLGGGIGLRLPIWSLPLHIDLEGGAAWQRTTIAPQNSSGGDAFSGSGFVAGIAFGGDLTRSLGIDIRYSTARINVTAEDLARGFSHDVQSLEESPRPLRHHTATAGIRWRF